MGVINTDSRGVVTLRDQLGVILGKYDPKSNQTTNFAGQVIGTGNLLTMLLKG